MNGDASGSGLCKEISAIGSPYAPDAAVGKATERDTHISDNGTVDGYRARTEATCDL